MRSRRWPAASSTPRPGSARRCCSSALAGSRSPQWRSASRTWREPRTARARVAGAGGPRSSPHSACSGARPACRSRCSRSRSRSSATWPATPSSACICSSSAAIPRHRPGLGPVRDGRDPSSCSRARSRSATACGPCSSSPPRARRSACPGGPSRRACRSSSRAARSRASATAACSSPASCPSATSCRPSARAPGRPCSRRPASGSRRVVVNVLGGQLHGVIGYRRAVRGVRRRRHHRDRDRVAGAAAHRRVDPARSRAPRGRDGGLADHPTRARQSARGSLTNPGLDWLDHPRRAGNAASRRLSGSRGTIGAASACGDRPASDRSHGVRAADDRPAGPAAPRRSGRRRWRPTPDDRAPASRDAVHRRRPRLVPRHRPLRRAVPGQARDHDAATSPTRSTTSWPPRRPGRRGRSSCSTRSSRRSCSIQTDVAPAASGKPGPTPKAGASVTPDPSGDPTGALGSGVVVNDAGRHPHRLHVVDRRDRRSS